jgi:hypothetical protein
VWLRTSSGEWEITTIGGANGIVPPDLTIFDSVAGYTNPTRFSLGAVNEAYRSIPNEAVPWLRIANRPFISQFELASVPMQSNGLMLEHVIWTNPTTHNHYTDDLLLTDAANAGLLNPSIFPAATPPDRIPGYLFNFYGQIAPPPGQPFTPNHVMAPARIFEYTSVPSPFVGTETFLNPLARAAGGFGLDSAGIGGLDGPRYGAPYNFLSNRRIPGKINLNTINYQPTWDSLMLGAYNNLTTFPNFVAATHNLSNPNPMRHMAFRSFDPTDPDGDIYRRLRLPRSIELVPSPYYNIFANLWTPTTPASPVPFFDHNSNAPQYDTTRNEYFRLQKRQRMANLTTQRSSVFAVRITVGYFELEEVAIPIPNDPNVPLQNVSFSNGLVEWRTAIGREHGLDRGTVRRDRAFYVVDRSIPVGFFPGENLNVDQAVLIRKYLP